MKEVKAKTVSLISKIIGIVVILGGFVLKSFKVWDCETDDIIKIGFSIMAICSTVDINLMLEKFAKNTKTSTESTEDTANAN